MYAAKSRTRAAPEKNKNPWDDFYLREPAGKSQDRSWDPWPVDRFRSNALFDAANEMIKKRNEKSVANFIDRVVLLPASNNVKGVQGGTSNTDLYSLRSPSKLPLRTHLWMTPRGRVMVRKGTHSIPFTELLDSFEAVKRSTSDQQNSFWKSLEISENSLQFRGKSSSRIQIPSHLYEAVHRMWWKLNIFNFLALPAELREMVMKFAVGHITEPYGAIYRPKECLPLRKTCTNLVLVSKQVRKEAMPILLSQVTFAFRKHGQLLRFFEQIPKPSLYALQSLELSFDHETLLDFFGARVFRHSPEPGFSTSDYYFQDTLFTNSLRLRHIRIYFPHPRQHLNSKRLRSACQRTVCLWIWAAARRCLRNIPNVEFEGCIKTDQKKEWLEELALERQGIIPDPDYIKTWQTHMWNTE